MRPQPEEFQDEQYELRPKMFNRQTELLIVVTLYNENEVLFCRTMHGVMKNIAHLCRRKNSSTWGPDGWKSESRRARLSLQVDRC